MIKSIKLEKLPKLKKTKKEEKSEIKKAASEKLPTLEKIKEPMPSAIESYKMEAPYEGKGYKYGSSMKESVQEKAVRTGKAKDAEAAIEANKKALEKAIRKMKLPKRKKSY